MLKLLTSVVTRYPKLIIGLVLGVTIYLALQLPGLRWETDARVYLPKGHAAILYDEKVDELFGVKDAVIIGIVNDEHGVFNPNTLARIARITEKIATLPGVIADRPVDVASLSTATIFTGDDTSIGTILLMPKVPTDDVAAAHIKETVFANSDLFIGNLVSADGKAAMIRARLKEGQANRYQTYWQIQGILAQEKGGSAGGGWQGGWKQGGGGQSQDWQQGQWGQSAQKDKAAAAEPVYELNGDTFYMAGRPVIEVTSGMHAMDDMKVMIPLLMVALAITLFLVFRTGRGVALPLFVMGAAIVWTMGIMALLDFPLYTISTMLPVILVAVSIGDSVHLMSHYYDHVLEDAHRPSATIVTDIMNKLNAPLLTTSVTTAVGFLTLYFAEMPPFVVFGMFTVLGIVVSWLLTITFIPAVLTLMKPKIGGYLAKRRALRVHAEQNRLTKGLVRFATFVHRVRYAAMGVLAVLVAVAAWGATKLYVDSSWMNDFRQDSELVAANNMLNKRFDGAIFLNVVIEGARKDAFKSPELLKRLESLQAYGETLPYVGSGRSVVDYIKNMNMSLHAGDKAYNVIPETEAQIGEYLFLFSVSGRPQQLDEIIDYDYKTALLTFIIKTDHTQDLHNIIQGIKQHADEVFAGQGVKVNYAGSANNSYIWAGLLIDSQMNSIVMSKIAILLIAIFLFRAFKAGLFTVIPVSLTTLFIAGYSGFAGIPIDVSTALAAGVAVGVGVDYAIHFIYRYQAEYQHCQDVLLAAQATMRSVGKTIVFNAVVVTVGFSVLFWSQFPPHVKLGYFVVAYMVISCIVALAVLPLLYYFRYSNKVRVEDVAHA